jgi:hypothetical protein
MDTDEVDGLRGGERPVDLPFALPLRDEVIHVDGVLGAVLDGGVELDHVRDDLEVRPVQLNDTR